MVTILAAARLVAVASVESFHFAEGCVASPDAIPLAPQGPPPGSAEMATGRSAKARSLTVFRMIRVDHARGKDFVNRAVRIVKRW